MDAIQQLAEVLLSIKGTPEAIQAKAAIDRLTASLKQASAGTYELADEGYDLADAMREESAWQKTLESALERNTAARRSNAAAAQQQKAASADLDAILKKYQMALMQTAFALQDLGQGGPMAVLNNIPLMFAAAGPKVQIFAAAIAGVIAIMPGLISFFGNLRSNLEGVLSGFEKISDWWKGKGQSDLGGVADAIKKAGDAAKAARDKANAAAAGMKGNQSANEQRNEAFTDAVNVAGGAEALANALANDYTRGMDGAQKAQSFAQFRGEFFAAIGKAGQGDKASREQIVRDALRAAGRGGGPAAEAFAAAYDSQTPEARREAENNEAEQRGAAQKARDDRQWREAQMKRESEREFRKIMRRQADADFYDEEEDRSFREAREKKEAALAKSAAELDEKDKREANARGADGAQAALMLRQLQLQQQQMNGMMMMGDMMAMTQEFQSRYMQISQQVQRLQQMLGRMRSRGRTLQNMGP